jgi:DNA-binding MarR family transcriptional regulator
MRFESIEPYERVLESVGGRVAGTLDEPDDRPIQGDPRYILGRIDGLLDACDMAIDRSVSNVILESARERSHVYPILSHLRQMGETRAGDLAEAVRIAPNYLSNILRWMEDVGLVRRASIGRASLVSLGPKAAVVYSALQSDLGPTLQVESGELTDANRAYSELVGAVQTPTAA